jgi:hypothetical protein
MRDNGPIFVTDEKGGVALVHFRFNSWGNKFLPFDRDAEVPKHIASHLGMRRYEAPWSWKVDRSSRTARARSSPPNSASCIPIATRT